MLRFRRNTEPTEISVTITTETYIRIAGLIIATITLILAVQRAAHALLLVFTAFFLALALNGPVSWLGRHLPGKRKGSRSTATAVSFLVVVMLLGGFLASIVPPLVHQTQSFVSAAPDIVKDFRSQDSATGRFIREHGLEKQVDTFSNQLTDRLKHLGGSAFSTAQTIGSSVFSLLTILVLTFMMLVEGPRWLKIAREIIPEHHHDRLNRISHDMYRVITGYVNGQVTLAAIAASLLLPAMLILGISYPVALMVVVFICGLIPMVGHTIGAVIVTTVALFTSTSSALIILAYYIFYQQMENYLIQPKIQANSTNMSPLLVFLSVVIGVSFGGLFGGLFAIPIAGCLRIVLIEYLHEKEILESPKLKATSETK